MDRKIQPEIQTLKNFRILPPVRMTLPNGIPLTVINAGEQEVVRIDVLLLEPLAAVAETASLVYKPDVARRYDKIYGCYHCRETGLLRFVARTVQLVGICIHHCLFVE